MELFLRVLFSLVAVLGLMWFLARVAARKLDGPGAALVRLVGRQSVGRSASVAVVAVGQRMLVVGVTENGVRLLTELDEDDLAVPVPDVTTPGPTVTADGARVDTTAGAESPGLVPHGSVLSTQTWKQAWKAATQGSRTEEK